MTAKRMAEETHIYGVARTQENDEDTMAHIQRADGKSLCGVRLTFVLGDNYFGWNLCAKCSASGKGTRPKEW